MSEEERRRAVEAIAGESAPVVQCYAVGSKIAFELSTNLAIAEG